MLLVIFILTTHADCQRCGGQASQRHQESKDPPHKATDITVQKDGKMYLNKEQLDLNGLQEQLIALRFGDPDLSVIRLAMDTPSIGKFDRFWIFARWRRWENWIWRQKRWTKNKSALLMKKTSRRDHSTMSELNITPLLDLVFVLLVISLSSPRRR